MLIHIINGVPLRSVFKSYVDAEIADDDTAIIRARYSAIFSNWILFRRYIVRLGLAERRNVIVDFSRCRLVDHSVMEKLHDLEREFDDAGLVLDMRGLEAHKQLSEHELAARKRGRTRLSRVTVVAEADLGEQLTDDFVRFGVSGFTSVPCTGAGRSTIKKGMPQSNHQVRIEAIASKQVAEQILDYINSDVSPKHNVTACLETVEVLRRDQF